MGLTINTNLSSLLVQNSLGRSTKSLNSAIERMTTGYRINAAKDNAAGYTIAKNMDVKQSSIDVVLENTSMGISMVQTANSSLDLVTTHLQRIRDLVVEAGNGTYDEDSKSAIQAEINQRQSEIQRILSSTEFNGIRLLDNPTDRPITGTFMSEVTPLTEEEAIAQGYTVIKTASELLSIGSDVSGDGTFKYILMNDINMPYDSYARPLEVGDHTTIILNGNGHVINGLSMTWGDAGLFSQLGNNSIIENLGFENVNLRGNSSSGAVGPISGICYNSQIINCYSTGNIVGGGVAGGLAGDAYGTTIKDCYSTANVTLLPGGYCSDGLAATGSPTIQNSYSPYSTGSSQKSVDELNAMVLPPHNAFSNIKLRVGIDTSDQSELSVAAGLSIDLNIDISTVASSTASIANIDNALNNVTKKQTYFGSMQNRLDSVLEQLNVYKTSITSSLSTVKDADIATVSSNYIKSQILQQASSTLLTTANQQPAIALQLI